MATDDQQTCVESGNVVSMARIELLSHTFGHLLTGPVPIVRGTHFPPFQQIRLEVHCRDGHGRPWKSISLFQSDRNGIFDTSLSAAKGESYHGVDREGPFTSMTCQMGPGYEFSSDELGRLTYTLSCFIGVSEIWSRQVTRTLGRDPRRGDFRPWVRVLLFDDAAGFPERDVISALGAYGVAVTGQVLEECSNLADRSVATVARDVPTFIVGSGRASARALEAAIRLSRIEAVILFSGSGLRFTPANELDGATEAGERDSLLLDSANLQPPCDGFLCTRPLYVEAVADKRMRDLAIIKVEDVACPIYMFSGLDDQIWPSTAFSELIVRRRESKGCPHLTLHRVFEGVGHDLGPSLGWPTLPTAERSISHPDTGARLRLGGKPTSQARARRECWDSLLGILSTGSCKT